MWQNTEDRVSELCECLDEIYSIPNNLPEMTENAYVAGFCLLQGNCLDGLPET